MVRATIPGLNFFFNRRIYLINAERITKLAVSFLQPWTEVEGCAQKRSEPRTEPESH
jgi:hypothetical protein